MIPELTTWRNQSPGNLDLRLDEVHRTPIPPLVDAATKAAPGWARVPLSERIERLRSARSKLEIVQEDLALQIAIETGKPLAEARGELGAVLGKFELSFADASRHLADERVTDGPHPARVRRRARGVAAVIAPFNFPIHLGHGASLPHLLAGNPVVFKPSPSAAGVAGRYARIMAESLPPGVFALAQGGADCGIELCTHPSVRSICFTGSATAGRHLAQLVADDFSKDLALELGGKNAAIVWSDADLPSAAQAVADGMCLTAGQRCNATSRVILHREIAPAFLELLIESLRRYTPADPTEPEARLGPLIDRRAWEQYRLALDQSEGGDWILHGEALRAVDGLRGFYVQPAVFAVGGKSADPRPPLLTKELFAPLLAAQTASDIDQALAEANRSVYGLSCSVFTKSEATFWRFADELQAGNVYANLPTTFSPSTLPFGGWGESGNGKPGGRGFIRFVTAEQAIQIRTDSLA
ncbi:MAG: aldehyde dehydrogenase family protein [Verrucomicrobia bacterium]|nr:aldehyde dehydrogenase family protein [Verrucomicrobiota bacterium]MBI3870205.1 aldehyde dehydrogenase family protein [Verrucomicrobiota bacterium]